MVHGVGARDVLRGVVAACILAACPPASPPTAPKAPPLAVRRYEPFAFKDDALDPGRAVLLGTDDAGGSTLLALPAGPTRTRIDVVDKSGLVAFELASAASPTRDARLVTGELST